MKSFIFSLLLTYIFTDNPGVGDKSCCSNLDTATDHNSQAVAAADNNPGAVGKVSDIAVITVSNKELVTCCSCGSECATLAAGSTLSSTQDALCRT